MAAEIERKYRIEGRPPVSGCERLSIVQGYFSKDQTRAQVTVTDVAILVKEANGVFRCQVPRNDARQLQRLFANSGKPPAVRVRLQDGKGIFTIKGWAAGITRPEFEYPIPYADACRMLDEICGARRLYKTRYLMPYQGLMLEIDVFQGFFEGRVLGEVELPTEDTPFDPPDWFGEEVSEDYRYTNAYMADQAYGHHVHQLTEAAGTA